VAGDTGPLQRSSLIMLFFTNWRIFSYHNGPDVLDRDPFFPVSFLESSFSVPLGFCFFPHFAVVGEAPEISLDFLFSRLTARHPNR